MRGKPAKRVREVYETEIERDSWNVPSVLIYVNCRGQSNSPEKEEDIFEVGDRVRVTVERLAPRKGAKK